VIIAKVLFQSVKIVLLSIEACLRAPVICINDVPVLLGGCSELVDALC
jgi:hypothetical protein